MSREISRRRFLVSLAAAGSLMPLLRVGIAEAYGLPRLTQNNNALAKLNDYVDDAGQIDSKRVHRFKPGEHCGNCAFFEGGKATWGGCMAYPDYLVNINGWCKAYARVT